MSEQASPPEPASRGGTTDAAAVWFLSPRQAVLRGEPVGAPGPGQARVRALLSAISQGTEMLVYRGQAPARLPLDLPTLTGSYALPIKFGYASAGRVIDIGPGVEDLEAGDLVFCLHPHQTEYVAPADTMTRLSPTTPPTRAVFLANLDTALNALLDCPVRLGETVLVLGQGVVGLLITALCWRAGAGQVVAVDPLAVRRAASARLGATTLAPDPRLAATLRELTAGRGADLIFEVSGSEASLQAAIECAAFQGTIVVCSWFGIKPVRLDLGGAFHRQRLRLVSSQVGHLDPALTGRWDRSRRLAVARDLLAAVPHEEWVTHRFPIQQAADAYRLVDQHPEETIQVVLTYDENADAV